MRFNGRLLLCLVLPAVGLATAEDAWQKQLKSLDARHAQQRQPILELLIGELGVQAQALESSKPGSIELARLQARIDTLELEAKELNQRKSFYSGSLREACGQFFVKSAGWEWSIQGTRNVRRVTARSGELQSIAENESGVMGSAARDQVLPGVFRSSRDGGGCTYYLISPDLQTLRCVIATDSFRGRQAKTSKSKP